MSVIPGYLTVTEAALKIGVSHSQVTRYIANDLLKAIEIGQQKLIPEKAVVSFKRPPRGNPLFQSGRKSKRAG